MNKPWIIWTIAALCACIVFTALGVVTHSTIENTNRKEQQAADADREEHIRLAMWRLDTLAAAIIAQEDERSAYDFKKPKELPTVLQAKQEAESQFINPLYNSAPDVSNLYWNLKPHPAPTRSLEEIEQDLDSPQVYSQEFLTGNGIDSLKNDANIRNYVTLKKILTSSANNTTTEPGVRFDNRSLSCTAAHISLDKWGNTIAKLDALPSLEQISPNTNDTQSGSYSSKANQPLEQTKLSQSDKQKRLQSISRLGSNKNADWSARAKEKIDKKSTTAQQTESNDTQQLYYKQTVIEEPEVSPFTPIWLDDELMLVRKVEEPAGDIVQGVWLNRTELFNMLREEIADLFPDATFEPVLQDITEIAAAPDLKGSTRNMLKLPLKLIPNKDTIVSIPLAQHLYGPIGLAWIGALLAGLAGFFMLKSVLKMSERRASFVSSVTHELRTPLTTFRLYSDLLSTGMVKDPEKQQVYLGTLKHEADRLTHLVDNVLSYSRIEKGSAKAKVEETTLENLIQRMESRLTERATEEGMNVDFNIDHEILAESIKVDTTAVEQIIFNLVDNACKYASGDNCGKDIEIRAFSDSKSILIHVCDEGNGILHHEKNRLFKPFHKSAKEAADTKPGVGLGLALCRRLAKAMRGALSILDCPNTKGACFELKLPKK